MERISAGDIVTVPFPFIDRPIQKRRPALVLSGTQFVESHGVVVLCMITSARRSRWGSDIMLIDWSKAGLRSESIVRWKLFTLDEALVIERRGALSARDREAVSTAFGDLFRAWC